jgi:hypothetical protein
MDKALQKQDEVLSLREYKGFQSLTKNVGGLATISEKKLAVIAEKMVAIDRANHTAGRSQTQTTNQLMTLTMMTDSPYRRLRQCLAQIENKRKALEESYFGMQKKKVQVQLWYEKGDEMSIVRAKQAESGMIRLKDYIDGAFKEIATFQCAYDEIREAHNIPEKWDERDAEEAEIDHHIKQAFRQAHRDMVSAGKIGLGNMEYLEQYGVHIQTATKIIAEYINDENDMIAEGKFPSVNSLYAWLDRMAETFHDAHKDVMARIGIKDLLKEDFLYLEEKNEDS